VGGPPGSGWTDVLKDASSDSHLVQFYRDDGFLVRAVSTWTGHALIGGGAAILIGTPAHRKALQGALARDGFDVSSVVQEQRLLLLDADATLGRFYRDGHSDPKAFKDAIGEAVATARGDDEERPVRAWGEMVNLLSERGDSQGAMAVEELWNGFLRSQDHLRLLCSYHADPFDTSLYASKLRAFTHGHSRLLPVEDEEFLEASVQVAMRQVCGFSEAEALRSALGGRAVRGLDLTMPAAQRLLINMHHVLPDYGRKVIERAGAHYRAVVS